MKAGPLPAWSRLHEDGWLASNFSAIDARRRHTLTVKDQLAGANGSLWDWALGHRWYGLHRLSDGSWIYRDWAPHATRLALVGDFSHWEPQPGFEARRINDHGDWEVAMPSGALEVGQHYRVRLWWPDGGGDRLPAWGTAMHQDAKTLLFTAKVVEQSPYPWQHETPLPSPFTRIYEAHTGMALEEPRVGTWVEFRDQMLPRIKAAGYDTVQLMAVMEHPYYGSFGYHVGSFFAPSSRFGSAEDLQSLVDTAHGLGLRVIMDLVHSHAVKNEVEGLSRYDGSSWQYFHEGARGEHGAWDSRCFNYGKREVLHFLLSNLRYWLEDFRFDGFRFDGVTSMLYLDHGLGTLFSCYDDYFNGNVDTDAVTYLTLAHHLIQEGAPNAITVAEDVSGMPGLGARLDDGGIGFTYRLCMGMPDCWFKLVKDMRDEDWSMNWLWHELRNHRGDERAVSYVESHDQALVGGKSFIFECIDADMYTDMHVGSQNLRVERGLALHKMARLATLGAAGHGYLNFMGNEFGHPEWIDFPREGNGWSCAKARRQWSLRDNPALRFKALGDFDSALMHLVSRDWAHPPHLLKADDGDKVLAFLRGDLFFVFNFHPFQHYHSYGFETGPGSWQQMLSTDDLAYGGFSAPAEAPAVTKSPWLQLDLPPRTASVWRLTGISR
jgi:1,4-alpha-glucan branching enzyme